MPLPLHFDNISEFTNEPDMLCHQASHHLRATNLVLAVIWHAPPHPKHDCIQTSHHPCQWVLLHFKDRQQRLREMCQLPHHHTTSEGQSVTEHSRSDSQVHTRSLDQPCLLCSGTVTGHSKHMYAQTLKASRCSSPWNVLPSPPALPFLTTPLA